MFHSTRLARAEPGATLHSPDETVTRRTGPAVPGVDAAGTVIDNQQAVDDLLSDLGM